MTLLPEASWHWRVILKATDTFSKLCHQSRSWLGSLKRNSNKQTVRLQTISPAAGLVDGSGILGGGK